MNPVTTYKVVKMWNDKHYDWTTYADEHNRVIYTIGVAPLKYNLFLSIIKKIIHPKVYTLDVIIKLEPDFMTIKED